MKMWLKLFLGFSVVITIVVAVGYITIHMSQGELENTIGETSAELAKDILEHIDFHIYSRIETIQENVHTSITQRTVSESNKEFEKLDNIQAYIAAQDLEWTLVPKKEMTPFIQELTGNELSRELRRIKDFYQKKHNHKVFVEVFITNKYGANIAQTGKTSDYYQADERWWQEAKKDGLYIEDVEYDESADVYSTDICVRIDDQAGNFSGVIKAVLSIDDAVSLLKSKEHKNVEFKLLTKDRRIIYSTEDFELLENISTGIINCVPGQETHKNCAYFIGVGDKSGEEYELYAHAHSTGYEEYKGLDWILLVEHDTDEIFASSARLKSFLLLILFVFTVFAVLTGLFISYSIYRPLSKLKNAMAQIGKGKLDTRVEIKSNDEIGFLADSINKMAEDLKHTQSQMIQNEKLASIGQLAAGVAHEMNTPVGFVASNFQTLEDYLNKFLKLLSGYKEIVELIDTGTKEERLTKLQEINEMHNKMKIDFILEDIHGLFDDSKEGLDRVTDIVQNLRDFSRIDRPGSRDKYDLNKGIEATLIVAKNAIKYDADVKTDFSELPMIFCHSGQINQVFLNILVNAAHAIKAQERDGNGTITIKTYASETGVVCEIADDGPGIPPEVLSKVFDPFFTTKPAGKGTGLGLSVSYDIITNKHKGKLLVDSTVGEGTKFTITLPISTKENSEKETINNGKENRVICG